MRLGRWARLVPVLLIAATAARAEGTGAIVVDSCDDAAAWSARPADGVGLVVSADTTDAGRALRLDFRFTGGGYAVVHRDLSLDLPDNWAFRFRLRGAAPPNHLEFKLIDASGENVWWNVHRDLEFPATWRTFSVKKRQVTFAWGPLGGGDIRHVAAIEFAVTAGSGGEGTVWLDDLELVPLPPEGTPLPAVVATASSARFGRPASAALDGRPTAWMPASRDTAPSLRLDFGVVREFGGLDLEWAPGRQPRRYAVDRSEDGAAWETVREVVDGDGGRDPLFLPESEARYVRVRMEVGAGAPVALREIRIRPLEWSASRERFIADLAASAPRGAYPRGISGEQSYWTVVGADRDEHEGLLDEDGALETGKRRFSIEPFLREGGRLVTWADARISQALPEGDLPMPSVTWEAPPFALEVLAFGDGERGRSSLVARYRVTNRSAVTRDVSLVLALRPFQVNPPAQFLNVVGGTAPVHRITRERDVVRVDESSVVCLTPPTAFAATTFDGGDIVADWLERGALPASTTADDAFGAASAALEFARRLGPGETAEVAVVVPLEAGATTPDLAPNGVAAWVEGRWTRCRAVWRGKLSRVVVKLPDSAARVEQSLRAQLGWILVNRSGPAIQPGTRAYARSWIRDGALTSSALLRTGHTEAARDFLEWFAPHQYGNGKIPCVVDARGADPVPEHDSSGEFIFLVAECLRYDGDEGLARRMWPRVAAAVDYLDGLRREEMGSGVPAFRGILPPSISHEGYSAKPMHSYWDDFWAYRGFRDAAWLAGRIGETAEQARIEGIRDEFGAALAASVRASMAWHDIDYVPGCADLGDFDATSTTIALAPTGAAALLPREAVERTFERYERFFASRQRNPTWTAYTPYEIRNVGAFVRLGWRERAAAALDFFLDDQRPPAWRQWPEVVWRDARTPHFLGDLPHGWVGSDYVRSVLDMLAFVDDGRDALVVGAGVPTSWLEGSGVEVRGLPTPWGGIDFTLRREGRVVVAALDGTMRVPSGGIVVRLPRPRRDGGTGADTEEIVHALPARVIVAP